MSNERLRDTIHSYLAGQPDLSAVKMKDLRSHIQSLTGISVELLKGDTYRPLVESFAAEFILPSNRAAREELSRSRSNSVSTEISSNSASVRTRAAKKAPAIKPVELSTKSPNDNTASSTPTSAASFVPQKKSKAKDSKSKAKLVEDPLPTLPAKEKEDRSSSSAKRQRSGSPSNSDTRPTAAPKDSRSSSSANENRSSSSTAKEAAVTPKATKARKAAPLRTPNDDDETKDYKSGKFSQHEIDIVRSTIEEYCKMRNIEPTDISWYFRASSGVVEKFVKPLKEGKRAISKPSFSTKAIELVQDVEEDVDDGTKGNRREHSMLYTTLSEMLPHRKPVAIRQFVSRYLLNEFLPRSKFTEQENEKLLELSALGHSYTVIGRALGRRPGECDVTSR